MFSRSLSLKSSVVATIAAGGFLAAAAVGQLAADQTVAKKGDRFQVVGEELCGDQAWPNITAACVAWKNGAPNSGERVRYITVPVEDRAAGVTELRRVAVPGAE